MKTLTLSPHSTLWWDFKNIARAEVQTHNEDLKEFIGFNRAAIEILERNPGSFVDGVSIPQALSCGMLLPHSEDLPFYISGLRHYIQSQGIQQIVLIGFFQTPLQRLARDVGESLGLQVKSSPSLGCIIDYLKSHFSILSDFLSLLRKDFGQYHSSPEILFYASKPRSLLYLNPLLIKIKGDGKLKAKVYGNTQESLGKWRIANLFIALRFYFQFKKVWKKSKKEILNLETKYKGVKISAHYADEIKKLWLTRGLEAALLANKTKDLFASPQNKVAVFIDPLEGSYVLSQRAKKQGVRRLFIYSLYTGSVAVDAIWVESMKDFADVIATQNQWLKDRVLEKKLLPESYVQVVGELLGFAPTDEEKKQARHKIGSEKKNVLLISRSASSALTSSDKEALFKNTFAACQALGTQLIVKAHPYEKRKVLEEEMKQWGCTATLIYDELTLRELVLGSDVAVNYPTGAATHECFYARVPVILVGGEKEYESLDRDDAAFAFRLHGAAVCLTSSAQILDPLKKIIQEKDFAQKLITHGQDFMKRIGGRVDGGAKDDILGEIHKLLN